MNRSYLIAALAVLMCAFCAEGREKYNFNRSWLMKIGDMAGAERADYKDSDWSKVDLPRAFNEDEAFRVSIEDLTDTVVWYRKHFSIPGYSDGRKVFLEMEGIRMGGRFWLNGHEVGLHENGVTAFGFDLTPYIRKGDNLLAVRIDNSWDYRSQQTGSKYQWNDKNFNANYGGIVKNTWLHVTDDNVYQTLPLYSNLGTTGVYVYGSDYDIPGRKVTVHAESQVSNESGSPQELAYRVRVTDPDGNVVGETLTEAVTVGDGLTVLSAEIPCTDMEFWSWGYGYLYDVTTELIRDSKVIDSVTTRTGFRKTEFADGKIRLNDRVIQMHGYAQRTSNEWPALGLSVPAWLSDFSNGLQVESGSNLVRWMHTCPSKQDVESCDRVGLIQAMPAGDAEKDCDGPRWTQRTEAMRDAIIYNRNNPSILFYESGNAKVSPEHMDEMMAIRDKYDPFGGRASGSREMLDSKTAEYGGEMLYINKSKRHPMWAMEYCRDEGLRKYWDEDSYPWHPEGEGPMHRNAPAPDYNRNQDQLAIEWVRRWYDYWVERPGQGSRVSSGGVKIIFSDTNTHHRGAENYRRSGATDAMRIPKDGYYVHQVMWDGWVDVENPRTYIIGHWNYENGVSGESAQEVVRDINVVSSSPVVRLSLNGRELPVPERSYQFLHTFKDVAFEPGRLEAVGYSTDGVEESRYVIETAGQPHSLRLTAMENPLGFTADGADVALIEFEIVDEQGRRCPLDNRMVEFSIEGPAEWRGGIAQGPDNYILARRLPVECGVNRALLRATDKAGKIKVTAKADGLPEETITLETRQAKVSGGLSAYAPSQSLKGRLTRGATPLTPSYRDEYVTVDIAGAIAASNNKDIALSYDDNELSKWDNDGTLDNARADYRLARPAAISRVSMKLGKWRTKRYPIEIWADDQPVWKGQTNTSLGYVECYIDNPVKATTYSVRLSGAVSDSDRFARIVELAGGPANELEAQDSKGKGKQQLSIVEIDFMEKVADI
ncbi:MAG: DUF4982 domain-containing protein [Duncaniella sp.]|nr:DUF4982 domain-containing protein [Duncaniella sp.]